MIAFPGGAATLDEFRGDSRPQPRRAPARILIVSRHDYRSKRRASVHFLAREMAGQGHDVAFVSVGYSHLSRLRGDSRTEFDARANRWETIDGVRAFLWRTAWHPGRLRLPESQLAMLYRAWARTRCDTLDAAAARADCIFIESGVAPVLIDRLRAIAPHARIVYRAADLLSTAGVPSAVEHILRRSAPRLDLVVVVARAMQPHFRHFPCPTAYVPHGIDAANLGARGENPYAGVRNIVTVGSMLFDADAVKIAAQALPDHRFHLIGTHRTEVFPPNVTLYREMPFEETLAYLHHADIGLAPYRGGEDGGADYLVDSSLKLLQFNAIGLPAVCPHFAVGDRPHRFGYRRGDPESIVEAFRAAAAAGRRPQPLPDWSSVATHLLEAAFG